MGKESSSTHYNHRSSGAQRQRSAREETEVQEEEKRLSLRLLGPPEASLRGHSLRFRLKKVLALLCYLAAEGGRHQRRELAELLWPQSEERRARMNLRGVLPKLKKTLGEDLAQDGEEEARLRPSSARSIE